MGVLDFLRWRALPQPIERRDALGQMPVMWQVGKPSMPERDPGVYDRDAYRKNALVFACTNEIAYSVALAPIRVYQEDDQQPRELPTHGMRRLLKRPNPIMGESRFMSFVAMVMATSGICVIEKRRAKSGGPVELWPLRTDWLYPIPRSNAAPDWEYRIPGYRRDSGAWDGRHSANGYPVLEAANTIPITWADRPDGYPMGIGPLEVLIREWGLLNTMQDFLQGYFDNAAMPRWGLKLNKDLGKGDQARAAADLIREMWAGRFMGYRGRDMRDIPLIETAEPIRLDDNMDDLALIDLRNVSEIAICQAFGVPGFVVGQSFAQEHSTYSNYAEANQAFFERTINRLWTRIDDALTLGLLPDFVDKPRDSPIFLQFDTSTVPAFQEDITAKRDHFLRAATSGLIKREQYKQAVGLPVEDGDDVYLIPFNVSEVPANGSAPQRATQRATGASVEVWDQAHPTRALPSGAFDSRGRVVPEVRERIQTRAVGRYDATARLFAPRIMLFFREQGRRVVARAERANRPPDFSGRTRPLRVQHRDVADVLDDAFWMSEDDELRAVLEQLWNSMGQQAVDDVSGLLQLGDNALTWDIANPWVQEVQSLLGQRITGINQTTRTQLADIITSSLDEGVSIPDLTERISGLFEETYKNRAENISRTESMVAYNEASVKGYEESGVVSQVELLDNPSHDTDPSPIDGLTCAGRNGKLVALGDARKHIAAEHPRGSLALSPVLSTPLGEI